MHIGGNQDYLNDIFVEIFLALCFSCKIYFSLLERLLMAFKIDGFKMSNSVNIHNHGRKFGEPGLHLTAFFFGVLASLNHCWTADLIMRVHKKCLGLSAILGGIAAANSRFQMILFSPCSGVKPCNKSLNSSARAFNSLAMLEEW